MSYIKTQDEYNKKIGLEKDIKDKPKDFDRFKYRLEKIHDIRKFEIELYWKRATYFWTFIAASFTVYGLTIDKPYTVKVQFIALCLGFIFSLAFYLVNKASKFWQLNWEKHTDYSEEAIYGLLYRITKSQSPWKNLFNPTKEYSASVSRINMILSLFIQFIWLGLFYNFFTSNNLFFTLDFKKINWFYTYSFLLTLIFSFYLIRFTRSDLVKTPKEKDKKTGKNIYNDNYFTIRD